jgi:molecular chaperone DnaK (HSP70)
VVNNYGFALFDAVEQGKRELSNYYSTVIRLQAKDIDVWQLLTRAQFEMIILGYYSEIASRIQDTVQRSGLKPAEIDAVVRTGGSSQIPCFLALLADQFGEEKIRLEDTFSGVTAGLAIRAWELDHGAQMQRQHKVG